MSRHEVFSPRWIPEESLLFPWFQSLGLEFLDVALLVHHRLNTPTRTLPGAISNMKHINEEQWRKGYPPMCDLGMLDWDKTAVVDYLIRLTDDENLLANLLWFDQQDVWMLISYQGLPPSQVYSVRGMQRELDNLLRKHRIYWRNRSLYGRRNFY